MAEAWRQEYVSCVRLKEQWGAGMAGSGLARRTMERDEVKAVMGRSHGCHLSRGATQVFTESLWLHVGDSLGGGAGAGRKWASQGGAEELGVWGRE